MFQLKEIVYKQYIWLFVWYILIIDAKNHGGKLELSTKVFVLTVLKRLHSASMVEKIQL